MKARVLSVLMWKHGVVRVRRFFNTTVDFVSPLLFFILLFAFKDIAKPVRPTEQKEPVAHTDIVPLADIIYRPNWILYSPDTPLTKSLMDDVGPKLGLKRHDSFPGPKEKYCYFTYSNATQLNQFTSHMGLWDAVVIFHKMTEDSWQKRLNYTIRIKHDFQTQTYESQDKTPGPHSMYGRNYETFMQIQWAIDTSYIKLLTGNETMPSVSFQEFPYYHTPKNVDTFEMCYFLMILCCLSMMLSFVFLMCRLLQERTSGIQELMKMVGVGLNTLGLSHFLNVLPCGLIFSIGATILCKVSSNPIIPNSNGFLIFLMLLLYFNTIISLAFVCSYISRGTQYATSMSVLAYVVLWIPIRVISDYKYMPYVATLASGFLPHAPMYWFWKEVAVLEIYGTGAYFSNMMRSHAANNGSVFVSYVYMILQATIFYSLAWYLSLVRPGQYGQALPWNFLFKRKQARKIAYKTENDADFEMSHYKDSEIRTSALSTNYEVRRVSRTVERGSKYSTQNTNSEDEDAQYWNKNEVNPDSDCEEEHPMATDSRYFEPTPANMEVGIKVVNVSKVYPKQNALRNVSLEVYKGEITVLVGHNGAGKTTLMSIITGMTSATDGKVYVNGKDTVTQRDAVRKNLGLCPQQNLFFPDLTVLEHIKFFTLLKQGTYSEADMSARKLADRLGIGNKLQSLSKELSGGMKRRAQLACALAGGADVLVLDEPTSGLDVETRRDLWDLLLSLRGERTVLLTTHFMEEADALGDRVAALHAGVLRCFATTMHLKMAVGTGYRLSLTTIGTPKDSDITDVVTSHVADASVKEKTINSISYSLPATSTKNFPKLFTALESKRSELGIDSIGVGVSTLEEVFLKLCSDVDNTLSDDEVDNANDHGVMAVKRLTGIRLYMRQLIVLLKRQVKYAIYKKWVFLILQIVLPLTMIFILTNQMNNVELSSSPSLAMNLDVYATRPDRRVLYSVSAPGAQLAALTKKYPRVSFERADDVATTMLRTGQRDILEYNKYLVGVELNDTDAKVLYTTTVHHAAPIALNLLSNLVASQYIPWADGRTVTTNNHPVLDDSVLAEPGVMPKNITALITWGFMVTFIILAANINCVSLVCKERQSGARHIHELCGCPAELHWAATLLFHAALVLLALVLPTALAAYLLDKDNTIDQPDMIATFALILLLGSLSFFSFLYLVSLNFGERSTSIIAVSCIIIFGIITPFSKAAYDIFRQEHAGAWYAALALCGWLAAPHTLAAAVLRCLAAARLNALCRYGRGLCPTLFLNEDGFNSEKCCAGENPACYFCINDYSPGQDMIILAVQFVVMMTLVMLTERGIFNGLMDKVMNAMYRPATPTDTDDMVRAEKAYVSKAIALPTRQIPDAMLVDDLHKTYVPLFKKKCAAVKGVSFSVKKGECFGLLGVNGAGKSSTFKMLTAEECATRGNIFGNGYHLKRGNSKYLQTLGYCPQFFGLDMFQTGEENLALVLTLRGFDEHHVKQEVKSWIQLVGLEKYAKRRVEEYSGGCVRRLGAAAALCGSAQLVLLDEPSAGVDVAARRRLWAALRTALRDQRSVIITSHSMDEMEALCSRIGILSGGRMRALGSAAALRAHHAAGHAVVFKVAHATAQDQVDSAQSRLSLLKGKLLEKFNCTLKDEHKTMLHYHINDTMRYSDLFAELEALRAEFPSLIEDYSVTETTLEEVFLSFAKEQQENTQTA